MIRELDTVVLAHDLEAYGLTQGDVGAVVSNSRKGEIPSNHRDFPVGFS